MTTQRARRSHQQKQQHDANTRTAATDTDALAEDLVRRGLASHLILDKPRDFSRRTRTRTDRKAHA